MYLRVRVVTGGVAITTAHVVVKHHAAETFLDKVGKEAQSVQLVLDLLLRLVVTQRGGRSVVVGVDVEVTEGGQEISLLSFGSLAELLLERLLVEHPPLDLCLPEVCSRFSLCLLELYLPFILRQLAMKCSGVAVVEATLLLYSTAMVLAVAMESLELVDHQHQQVISKHLNLLL